MKGTLIRFAGSSRCRPIVACDSTWPDWVRTRGRHVELKNDYELEEVKQLSSAAVGFLPADDPAGGQCPLAREAAGKPDVFAGGLRRVL